MMNNASEISPPKIPPRPRKQKTSDQLKINDDTVTSERHELTTDTNTENESELDHRESENKEIEEIRGTEDNSSKQMKESFEVSNEIEDEHNGGENTQSIVENLSDGENTLGKSSNKGTFEENTEVADKRASVDNDEETIMQENQPVKQEVLGQEDQLADQVNEKINEKQPHDNSVDSEDDLKVCEKVDGTDIEAVNTDSTPNPEQSQNNESVEQIPDKEVSDGSNEIQTPTVPVRPDRKGKADLTKEAEGTEFPTKSKNNETELSNIAKPVLSENSDSSSPRLEGASPIIPTRPKKSDSRKKSTTSVDNSDEINAEDRAGSVSLKESTSDLSLTESQTENLKPNEDSSVNSKTSNTGQLPTSFVPKIPSRPKKEENSSAKPKAPPPKPKKLSSKIAAFQQQLFQPQNKSETDVSDNTTDSIQETPKSRPINFKKFEGNGIPLPGMFNPAMLHVNQQQKPAEASESIPSAATSNIKRTRGPKGKKLPKAIANASVEAENNFNWESGSLWSFNFGKLKKNEIEISKDERVDADTELRSQPPESSQKDVPNELEDPSDENSENVLESDERSTSETDFKGNELNTSASDKEEPDALHMSEKDKIPSTTVHIKDNLTEIISSRSRNISEISLSNEPEGIESDNSSNTVSNPPTFETEISPVEQTQLEIGDSTPDTVEKDASFND
ncbi:AIM21 [Candida pseudojiufengensis]|uniref:AIM21 n=1 Tax=Candida pseudojiufengensis TaxID=497109 RepID=UPI0022242BAE|nr:AIM21 [Candida pseudojiufengensis]KAI5963799.1 AIM21 [Candida pseudojiufengensis]